jgi:hypothetical protein
MIDTSNQVTDQPTKMDDMVEPDYESDNESNTDSNASYESNEYLYESDEDASEQRRFVRRCDREATGYLHCGVEIFNANKSACLDELTRLQTRDFDSWDAHRGHCDSRLRQLNSCNTGPFDAPCLIFTVLPRDTLAAVVYGQEIPMPDVLPENSLLDCLIKYLHDNICETRADDPDRVPIAEFPNHLVMLSEFLHFVSMEIGPDRRVKALIPADTKAMVHAIYMYPHDPRRYTLYEPQYVLK